MAVYAIIAVTRQKEEEEEELQEKSSTCSSRSSSCLTSHDNEGAHGDVNLYLRPEPVVCDSARALSLSSIDCVFKYNQSKCFCVDGSCSGHVTLLTRQTFPRSHVCLPLTSSLCAGTFSVTQQFESDHHLCDVTCPSTWRRRVQRK